MSIRQSLSRRTTHLAVLALAINAVACSDSDPVTPTSRQASSADALSAAKAPINAVARALATALGDEAVRGAVRDAMRASPYVEHKLGFAEYLQSAEGQPVLAAVAAQLHASVSETRAVVAALPALDFYMGTADQRKKWTPAQSAAVVLSLGTRRDPVAAVGYDAKGTSFTPDPTYTSGERPAFVLARAESRGVRMDPQPNTRGAVIQDAGDGDIGIALVRLLPTGDSLVLNATSLVEARRMVALGTAVGPSTLRLSRAPDNTPMLVPCDASCGGDASVPPPQTTNLLKIYRFVTRGMCDWTTPTDICSDNEIEFKTWMNGAEQKVRVTGVPVNSDRIYDLTIRTQRPIGSQSVHFEVWETDIGNDDRYTYVDVPASDFQPDASGQLLSSLWVNTSTHCSTGIRCWVSGAVNHEVDFSLRAVP